MPGARVKSENTAKNTNTISDRELLFLNTKHHNASRIQHILQSCKTTSQTDLLVALCYFIGDKKCKLTDCFV